MQYILDENEITKYKMSKNNAEKVLIFREALEWCFENFKPDYCQKDCCDDCCIFKIEDKKIRDVICKLPKNSSQ